jgi:hypothetical protein
MNDALKEQFARAISDTGLQLQTSGAEVAAFAAARSAHLAAASQEPGFEQVFRDEQNRVWLFAAGRAVRAGDAADARAIGLIQGLLLGAASA